MTMRLITKQILLECAITKKYKAEDLSVEINSNIDKLVILSNNLQTLYGNELKFSCTLRDKEHNSKIPNAAPFSSHSLGICADIIDIGQPFAFWLSQKPRQFYIDNNFCIEHPAYTPKHVHIQIGYKHSSNQLWFKPSKTAIPISKNFNCNFQPL